MRLIPNQQKLPTAKVRDTYHMYTTVPLYVQFNTNKIILMYARNTFSSVLKYAL